MKKTYSILGIITLSILITGCAKNREEMLFPTTNLSMSLEAMTVQEEAREGFMRCTLDAKYPQVSGHTKEATEIMINDLLKKHTLEASQQELTACLRALTNRYAPGTEALDTLRSSFRLRTNEKGVLSISYSTTITKTGAEEPQKVTRAININLPEGTQYSLNDLFEETDVDAFIEEHVAKHEEIANTDAERNQSPVFYFHRGNLVLTELYTDTELNTAELRIPLAELQSIARKGGPIDILLRSNPNIEQ